MNVTAISKRLDQIEARIVTRPEPQEMTNEDAARRFMFVVAKAKKGDPAMRETAETLFRMLATLRHERKKEIAA